MMAVFKKEEYEEEKRKLAFKCEHGDKIKLSQLEALRRCGGELALGDFDLLVLETDIKTRHYTKRTSKKRAVEMLSELQARKPEFISAYAECGLIALANYVTVCKERGRRKKIALALCLTFSILFFAGGAAGLWFAERSGLLYGIGKVTFRADGQIYSQEAVKYNHLTALRIPQKSGYDILGIVDANSGEMVFDENGVSKEKVMQKDLSDYAGMDLEVAYMPHLYAATVCTLSGASARAFEFTVEDSLEDVLEEPRHYLAGYSFDGWFSDSAYKKPFSGNFKDYIDEPLVLYAKWKPITYHIDYDLDGGENSPLNPTSYTVENRVKLLEPKKTGYRFAGWYDANSGEYKSDLSAIDDGDVALVATWTAKEYTITVCPDNGQPAVEQRVTYDAYFCINPPILKGYSLDGLTFGGEQFEAVGVYEFDFDIVLVAHYQANKFQVTYISEGSMLHTQAITFGEVFRLYTPNERAGFEFVGWYDAPTGGNRVSDGVFDCDSNLVLYASWMKVLTINLESGKEYTVDKTIEKVYVIGNYTGESDNLMTDICITVSERDADLSMVLISAGFQAKENGTAIDCKNSSYTLTILLSGNSFIVGGKGSDGSNGKSGSDMTKSNCDGANGNNGGQALNCGTVIFEKADKDSSLTLKGGDGGSGGDGGKQGSRNRAWCNFLPNGGRGGDSGAALSCVSFSINNGATVHFEMGKEALGGAAGCRGTWAKDKNYGSAGSNGRQTEAVIYR